MPPDDFDPTKFEPPFSMARASSSRAPSSLGDTIVADVKRALFAGEIGPGTFLGAEKDFVQKYEVGRHSVREALRGLEATGLVEIRRGAHGGVVVAEQNLERFAEALAIQFKLAEVGSGQVMLAQSAIEGMAAELAATERTPDDLRVLAGLLETGERLRENPVEFSRNGLAFHIAVARASKNDVLIALQTTLRFAIWSGGRPRSLPDAASRVQGIHRQLFEFIETGNAEAAGRLMRTHIADIRAKHVQANADAAPAGDCC
jgi:DNA-binding FadR family transcriptional regulator